MSNFMKSNVGKLKQSITEIYSYFNYVNYIGKVYKFQKRLQFVALGLIKMLYIFS
jgi:hypothetical protein